MEAYSTGKVTKGNPELVMCDYMDCVDRGEFVRCYFDFYKQCQAHRLNEIIENINRKEADLIAKGLIKDGRSTRRAGEDSH